MRRIVAVGWVCLWSLAGMAAADEPPPPLEIVEAKYGTDGRFVDVSKPLAAQAWRGWVALIANNALADSDPVPRKEKRLDLRVRLRGHEEVLAVTEGRPLLIDARGPVPSAAADDLLILEARWGSGVYSPETWLDVTPQIRGLARQEALKFVFPEFPAFFAGLKDPKPDFRKLLMIRYGYGGRERVELFANGDPVLIGNWRSLGDKPLLELDSDDIRRVPRVLAAANPGGLSLTAQDLGGLGTTSVLGLLQREIARQAVLVAAREELGLTTRDESLGEPLESVAGGTFVMPEIVAASDGARNFQAVLFRRGEGAAAEVLWEQRLTLPPVGSPYAAVVSEFEGWSRTELPAALRRAGFEARERPDVDGRTPPPELLAPLEELDPFTQFRAARGLHGWVREHGPSPEAYAALARAYAQLGSLTEFGWGAASKAYQARGLLYAERAVALARTRDTLSARALAWALAGIHGPGAADVDEAEAKRRAAGQPSVGWQTSLAAFCHGDDLVLGAKGEGDGGGRPELSDWLELQFYRGTGERQTVVEAAARLLDRRPTCYQAMFAVWELGGLAETRIISQRALEVSSASLGGELDAFADLPEAARAAIATGKRRARGRPDLAAEWKARGAVVAALLEAGRAGDGPDPSWGALAALVNDLSFVTAEMAVWFNRHVLGVPADGELKRLRPLYAGHRYAPYLEAQASDPAARAAALTRLFEPRPLTDLSPRMTAMVSHLFHETDRRPAASAWNRIVHARRDQTFAELAALMTRYNAEEGKTWREGAVQLRRACPEHPHAAAAAVLHDWEFAAPLAAAWEKRYGRRALVQEALGVRYDREGRPEDAERCLRAAMRLHPTYASYMRFARFLGRRDRTDEWRDHMKAALVEIESPGLEHSNVAADLANHYVRFGLPEEALPYAEQAAESYSAAGLLAAVDCYSALGRYRDAERYVRACAQRYNSSEGLWHLWCSYYQRGDRDAARRLAERRLASGNIVDPVDRLFDECRLRLFDAEPAVAGAKLAAHYRETKLDWVGLLAAGLFLGTDREAEGKEIVAEVARKIEPLPPAQRHALHDAILAVRRVLTAESAADVTDAELAKATESTVLFDTANAEFALGCALLQRGDRERGLKHLALSRKVGYRSFGALAATARLLKEGATLDMPAERPAEE